MSGGDPAFGRALLRHARPLVLASASPRRRDILAGLGLGCEVHPSPVDEDLDPGGAPDVEAVRLARRKVDDVAARVAPDAVVLGADTVVALDGRLLGKPETSEDARAMLTRLSGRTHAVVTGVAVRAGGETRAASERTDVRFVDIPPAVIDAYVATAEPYDKAGGYGAQAMGRAFIERVDGCFFNVMGLPVARTLALLRGDEA